MRGMDESLAATRSQDDHTNVDDEELGRILEARKSVAEFRLSRLEDEQAQLMETIERERAYIDLADALLRNLGLTQEVPQAGPTLFPIGSQQATLPSKAFVAGNRSDKMPERRSEFANVSLIDAAKRLMSVGKAMNLGEIAEAIYDIRTEEELHAAKGNVRSAMANGVVKGLWQREKAGTFRAILRGAEQMRT